MWKLLLESILGDHYSTRDVERVVTALCQRLRQLLLHRQGLGWMLAAEWDDRDAEITDLTLDFIAPLFARDDRGHFIELRKFFCGLDDTTETGYEKAVNQLLNSVFKQETMRLFQHRDRFGKIFYRSLRHVFSKHPEWIRTVQNSCGVVITTKHTQKLVTAYAISEYMRGRFTDPMPLGTFLEMILEEILEKQCLEVRVRDLLSCVRRVVTGSCADSIPSNTIEDPLLDDDLLRIIQHTVQELDREILTRYEHAGKLYCEERRGFRRALEHLLRDYCNGGVVQPYFRYLQEELTGLESITIYKRKYRVRFEYVAKLAKSTFSARVRNEFNLE